MPTKHPGICPHCRAKVSPVIIEENLIRRDKCECPSCKGVVFACRTPGCDDYSKGGSAYDEELCPGCTKTLADGTGAVLSTAAGILVTAATTVAVAKMSKD